MLSKNSKDIIKYWCEERHKIYTNKKLGLNLPWSEDSILTDKKFCNVLRELDRETNWIINKWLKPLEESNNDKLRDSLWFAPFVFRVFNLGTTFENFDFDNGLSLVTDFMGNKDKFINYTKNLSETQPIFSPAYMLTTHGKVAKYKQQYYIDEILVPLYNKKDEILEILKLDSFEEIFTKIQELSLPGFKGFILYQALLDLTYTKYLKNHKDRHEWTFIGPGSVRGLNRLFGRYTNTKLSQKQAISECNEIREVMNTLLDKSIFQVEMDAFNHKVFDIHTAEFVLCEIDKYLRYQSGKGSLKKYKKYKDIIKTYSASYQDMFADYTESFLKSKFPKIKLLEFDMIISRDDSLDAQEIENEKIITDIFNYLSSQNVIVENEEEYNIKLKIVNNFKILYEKSESWEAVIFRSKDLEALISIINKN